MKALWLASFLLAASAQPSVGQPAATTVAPAKKPGEAEFLVAPGGGAFEVPVRIAEICILTFPDELTMSAIKSSEMFEVNAWNKVSPRGTPS